MKEPIPKYYLILSLMFLLNLQTLYEGICTAQEKPGVYADFQSPCAVLTDSDSGKIFIALAGQDPAITVWAVESEKIQSRFPLPERPNGMTLSKKGERLYVCAGGENGVLLALNAQTGDILKQIRTGHTPTACVLDPEEKNVYVCCRFENKIWKIPLATALSGSAQTQIFPVVREPVNAVITPDGKYLLAANHLPTGAADGEFIAASISVIDLKAETVLESILLPNGSTAVKDITLSPDGEFAYVPHILARYQLPTTHLDRGWMNTNAVSIIDVQNLKHLSTFLLDDADLGSANPWAAACSPDGKYLLVTHAGTHEVSIIDRGPLHQRLQQAAAGKQVTVVTASAENVPNDLGFLAGIRKRIKLPGNGPRSVCIAGDRAYIGQYYSDSLACVDLKTLKPISLFENPKSEMNPVRKGEMYFHDGTFCFQQWQSCSSCHPGDGRVDGLNWDLLNDGIGNPKNTKSLLYSHQNPPVMALGVRKDAESAVRAGMKYIQMTLRTEEELQAMDVYLKALKPVPSPYLTLGKFSAAAMRGQQIFEASGCARCHPGPQWTDQKAYDLKMGRFQDQDKKFDTPVLTELWRTAPYLYDGRSATLHKMLTTHNPDDRHGKTSKLTENEINDLTEFLLSL